MPDGRATRRQFVKTGALAGALGAWGRPARVRAATPPNLVAIVLDDMRFDEYGAGRYPYLETPAIDALGRSGLSHRPADRARARVRHQAALQALVIREFALSIDIVPTLLVAAGAEVPGRMRRRGAYDLEADPFEQRNLASLVLETLGLPGPAGGGS
jgi:hypothetical protein